jgi:DNA-binding transcriptional MerR regulator
MTHTVGELARLTGLTTRTLHHYENLGLLRPAQRSPAGYRLYDDASLAQLHAVLAYRYLGLPLKDIATLLANDAPPLRALLERQAALVEERIAQHERLLQALQRCTKALDDGSAELDETLLAVTTATRLCEESLSPDEHRFIAQTRASLNEADVAALQARSAALISALDAQRLRGADPASEPVLDLARQLAELRERVAGSDPVFHEKIRSVARRSPQLMRTHGVTPELAAYARAAREALERAQAGATPDAEPAAVAAKPRARSAKGKA